VTLIPREDKTERKGVKEKGRERGREGGKEEMREGGGTYL